MSNGSTRTPRRIGVSLRFDIHGHELTDPIHRARCADCGMGTFDAAEWHPYEACEVFKATHDSREVWRMLHRKIVEGDVPWKGI